MQRYGQTESVINQSGTIPQAEWRYNSTHSQHPHLVQIISQILPQPLYSWGKCHQYPSDRTLDAPDRWSGCYIEEKNLLPLLGIISRSLRCPSCSLTLYQLSYQDSQFQACSETKYVQPCHISTQKDFAGHNGHILQVLTSPMRT
jgi:hypothetical protein